MDEVIKEAAIRVPGLVVLAIVVKIFVQHLQNEGKMNREHARDAHERMELLARECHDLQRDGHAAISENSKAVSELKTMLYQVKETLRIINGKAGAG